jgi:hypothetical protein
MKFDPVSSRLYMDTGELIKQLHCPYLMSWSLLEKTSDEAVRRCDICDKSVTETAGMPDDAVLELVRRNPSACLKVSLDQDNLRVIPTHVSQ